MSKFLSTIIEWLNYFFNEIMKPDGMKHLIVGILLASILKFILPFALMLVTISVILVAKELLVDYKKGKPDMKDIMWGFTGVILGLI